MSGFSNSNAANILVIPLSMFFFKKYSFGIITYFIMDDFCEEILIRPCCKCSNGRSSMIDLMVVLVSCSDSL